MKTKQMMFSAVATICFFGCDKTPSIVAPGDRPQSGPAAAAKLTIKELQVGSGPVAEPGKTVAIHYTGYLESGAKFDSTANRDPLTFELGKGRVLAGWDQGIAGMKPGGKRRLVVPPALAYGGRSVGSIPPNSTLVFDVELVSVNLNRALFRSTRVSLH